ncbi:unnamed protein product [Nippostrongylus brasiliensis]|uniref:Cysteine-rich membrane protein 2 n=1 Tax=Nippostrongylus brasiliensis TaxID=27835 RepID=A0A0N4XYN8_NIPBR|nr:unnamed protein product [Nippostrongylus brasiliensis]
MAGNATVMQGGSSISGVFVSCYPTLESCLQRCYMSCYIADYCNDSVGAQVACAPALTSGCLCRGEAGRVQLDCLKGCIPHGAVLFTHGVTHTSSVVSLGSMASDDAEEAAFHVFTSGLQCLTERFPWTQKALSMLFGSLTPCKDVDWRMIILTLLFVITLCGCCCMICFCSPCCACAIWYKRRRNQRNRGGVEFSTFHPSAPPLLSKA